MFLLLYSLGIIFKFIKFITFSVGMCLFRLLTILLFILFLQILLRLCDNRLVETVGIPVEDGKGSYHLTACVSSQV